MLTQLRTVLARSRARYGEQLLTATTVILAFLLFVFAPLQAAGIIAFEALGFAAALVLIISTVAMSGSLVALGLMLFAFFLNGATVLKRAFDPSISMSRCSRAAGSSSRRPLAWSSHATCSRQAASVSIASSARWRCT